MPVSSHLSFTSCVYSGITHNIYHTSHAWGHICILLWLFYKMFIHFFQLLTCIGQNWSDTVKTLHTLQKNWRVCGQNWNNFHCFHAKCIQWLLSPKSMNSHRPQIVVIVCQYQCYCRNKWEKQCCSTEISRISFLFQLFIFQVNYYMHWNRE